MRQIQIRIGSASSIGYRFNHLVNLSIVVASNGNVYNIHFVAVSHIFLQVHTGRRCGNGRTVVYAGKKLSLILKKQKIIKFVIKFDRD